MGIDVFLFVRIWKFFRKKISRRVKYIGVGGKGIFFGDISIEIFVYELGFEIEGFKGSDFFGRDGNVEVFIVVEVEGDGGKFGEFCFDGGWVMMGGNVVGFVFIIVYFVFEFGSGGG